MKLPSAVFALVAVAVFALPATAGCVLPGDAAQLAAAAGAAMNVQREGNGRQPLGRDARLDKAAQSHACWMAETGTFSHKGAGGSKSKRRIDAAGYPNMLAAENIAWGQESATAVVADWMTSAGHRRNILLGGADDYGIGVAMMAGRPVWVMVFAGH